MSRSEPIRCECGKITGERCAWVGPVANTVVVQYMPEHLRHSHAAADYRPSTCAHPSSGARLIRVERGTCLDVVTHVYVDGERTNTRDPWVIET